MKKMVFVRDFTFLMFWSSIHLTSCSIDKSSDDFEPMSKWYTKFPHYPEYCSTQDQMNTRNIPPLKVSDGINTQLVHVTAIIRHGARAPHVEKCWSGWNKQK